MINRTTTIQEITLQAYAFGIYTYLFEVKNMSRDEILNLFAQWGTEFEYNHRNYEWEGDYYDEIDDFVQWKADSLSAASEKPVGEYKPNPRKRVVNGVTLIVY